MQLCNEEQIELLGQAGYLTSLVYIGTPITLYEAFEFCLDKGYYIQIQQKEIDLFEYYIKLNNDIVSSLSIIFNSFQKVLSNGITECLKIINETIK